MKWVIEAFKKYIISNFLWSLVLIFLILVGLHFSFKIYEYFSNKKTSKLEAKTEKFYKMYSLDSILNVCDSITAAKCDSVAQYYISRSKARKPSLEQARIDYYLPKDTSCLYNLKNCSKYASILEADNIDLGSSVDILLISSKSKDSIISRTKKDLFTAKNLVQEWQKIALKPKPKLSTFGTIGYNTFKQASAGIGIIYDKTGIEAKAITDFKQNGVELSLIYKPF